MKDWYLKSVGRFAAAIGESDRYSSEHLQWLRSGYVCQQCHTTLVKGRTQESARCYDADGERVGLLSIRRRGNSNRLYPARDSIVIYGRDTCGFTTAMRDQLTNQSIPFVYADIDKLFVSEEMWHHLQKVSDDGALHTAHLPVVLINGHIFQRPEIELVLSELQTAAAVPIHAN